MKKRVLLRVAYDGTNYHGWQVQPGVATVCGTVQDAVEKLFGRRGELTGCSRTDSGVHAAGFVAALGCAGCCIPPEALLRALKCFTPASTVWESGPATPLWRSWSWP